MQIKIEIRNFDGSRIKSFTYTLHYIRILFLRNHVWKKNVYAYIVLQSFAQRLNISFRKISFSPSSNYQI